MFYVMLARSAEISYRTPRGHILEMFCANLEAEPPYILPPQSERNAIGRLLSQFVERDSCPTLRSWNSFLRCVENGDSSWVAFVGSTRFEVKVFTILIVSTPRARRPLVWRIRKSGAEVNLRFKPISRTIDAPEPYHFRALAAFDRFALSSPHLRPPSIYRRNWTKGNRPLTILRLGSVAIGASSETGNARNRSPAGNTSNELRGPTVFFPRERPYDPLTLFLVVLRRSSVY